MKPLEQSGEMTTLKSKASFVGLAFNRLLQDACGQVNRSGRGRGRRQWTPTAPACVPGTAGPGGRIERLPRFPGSSGGVFGGEHSSIVARTMLGHNPKRRFLKGCVRLFAPFTSF